MPRPRRRRARNPAPPLPLDKLARRALVVQIADRLDAATLSIAGSRVLLAGGLMVTGELAGNREARAICDAVALELVTRDAAETGERRLLDGLGGRGRIRRLARAFVAGVG